MQPVFFSYLSDSLSCIISSSSKPCLYILRTFLVVPDARFLRAHLIQSLMLLALASYIGTSNICMLIFPFFTLKCQMRKFADRLCRNGIQQRKNSWEDGVYGTNCPILPGQNYTYVMQVKDQIGSYFYFPTLDFHKAAGGFGGIRVLSRPLIPVPYPPPAGDFTLLTGDWFKTNHTVRLNLT